MFILIFNFSLEAIVKMNSEKFEVELNCTHTRKYSCVVFTKDNVLREYLASEINYRNFNVAKDSK